MKAREKENQGKYADLIALSKKYPEKTASVPAFDRLMQKIEVEMNGVKAADAIAQQSTKGVTQDKNILQAALRIAVNRACNLMIGYAVEAKDVVLESNLTVLKNKFGKATMAQFADVCTEVVVEVRKLDAQWADYGIKEADIADIEAKIDQFKEKAPKGNDLRNDAKKAVRKRAAFFENKSITKKQILRIAASYIGVDDEFYSDILGALKVGKRGPRAAHIKVITKSADTQKPVADLSSRITDTDLTGISDAKGKTSFKLPKSGTYGVEITLPSGEIKTQKDVNAKRSKTTTVIFLV